MNMKKFRTTGLLRGPSTDALKGMADALRQYTFDFSYVYFTDIVFYEVSDGEISFRAEGPSGGFCGLSEVEVFRYAAKAGPDMYMEADIGETEWITNTREELHCRLEGGILTVVIKETTVNDCSYTYADYVVRELPFSRFTDLFRVRAGSLAEKDYPRFVEEMVSWCDDEPFDPGYDEFMEILRRFHGETSLSPEDFGAACSQMMKRLLTAREFLEQNSVTETETYRFDAKTGQQIS